MVHKDLGIQAAELRAIYYNLHDIILYQFILYKKHYVRISYDLVLQYGRVLLTGAASASACG